MHILSHTYLVLLMLHVSSSTMRDIVQLSSRLLKSYVIAP